MHELALAMAALAQSQGCGHPLRRARHRASKHRAAGSPPCARHRKIFPAPPPSSMPMQALWERACSAPPFSARSAPVDPAAALALRHHLGGGGRNLRLPAGAPQRVLFRRLHGGIQRTREGLSQPSPPSTSARRTARGMRAGRSACWCSSIRPPMATMRRRTRTPSNAPCAAKLGQCGLEVDWAAGPNDHHRPRALRRPVSGHGRRIVWEGLTRMDGIFSAARGQNGDTGALPGGGQRAPGAGRADGGTLRASGSGKPDGVAGFDTEVPSGGYRWWYLDGLSDDGRHGLTIIGFVGSVFSPYYALARRRGGADPANHCALNVALYGDGGHRWSMTERGRRSISRSASALRHRPQRHALGRGFAGDRHRRGHRADSLPPQGPRQAHALGALRT